MTLTEFLVEAQKHLVWAATCPYSFPFEPFGPDSEEAQGWQREHGPLQSREPWSAVQPTLVKGADLTPETARCVGLSLGWSANYAAKEAPFCRKTMPQILVSNQDDAGDLRLIWVWAEDRSRTRLRVVPVET